MGFSRFFSLKSFKLEAAASTIRHVRAVSKVLSTLFQASVTLKRNELGQKRWCQIDRSPQNLAILFCAFLANLPPFQSYKSLKKKGAINTFETASTA